MASIHVILDRDNKVRMSRDDGRAVPGVTYATLNIGDLVFEDGEVDDITQRLAKMLLAALPPG